MKNTHLSIFGIVLVSALGYAVFIRPENPAPRPSTETDTAETSAAYTAGAYQAFSLAAYQQAVADNKTVILDFHADWCPVCLANDPIIAAAFQTNTNTDLVGFKVNYDKETELKREFNIASQSTIIKAVGGKKAGQLGPGPVTHESFKSFLQS